MADLLDNNLRSEMLTTKSAIETIATEVLGLELFNQSESSTQEVGNDDENSAVCGWCYFFLVSVILCTMYGNLMVCLAVMFDKRLQNIINYFLVSLAMTDMAVAILVMPFAIVLAYNNGLWPLGSFVCNVYLHVDVLLCTSSILHLTIISLDRFLVIKYPLRHKIHGGSRCSTILKISLVWILSIMVAFPGYLIRNTNHSSSDNTTTNENKFLSEKGECAYFDTTRVFIIYSSTGSFFLPASIMAILYFATILELYGSTEFSRHADGKRNGAGINSTDAKSFVQRITFQSAQKKAMKVLGIVFTCFLISWAPFFVTYCLQGIWHVRVSPNWSLFVQWLGYLNSMLNPIIYTLFNQNFRRAFVLLCRFKFKELKMQKPKMITNQLQLARLNSNVYHQNNNNNNNHNNNNNINGGTRNLGANKLNLPKGYNLTQVTVPHSRAPAECAVALQSPRSQNIAKFPCYSTSLEQDPSKSGSLHASSCHGRNASSEVKVYSSSTDVIMNQLSSSFT